MTSFRIFPRLLASLSLLSLLVIAGCGGTPAAPSIAVSVTPASATLIGGGTQTFTATVTNDTANAGVTWTASTGTITSGGVYTAPAVIGATLSATITATSKTDATKTGTATVTLTPISVSVAPPTVTLAAGATQTFTATVTADGASAGVTWTASVGTITAGGVYTAPTPVATASATITATSKTDPTKTGTATVTLTPISVSVAPPTPTLIGGASQTFTATVTGDGTLNAGVTWTVSAGTGTITAGGVYTAPAVITTTSATVTATSKTDPTKTGTATVTLTPISVSVAPPTVTLIGGATQTFTATVTADGASAGVTWTASVGSITAGGVYTAPSPVATASATITATSKTDPTKTGTATVTLTPIAISFTTVTTGVTLDSGQTMTLAASVTNDSSASGATFAATGAGSIAPLSATGNTPSTTLTATGTTASTVTVTATSIKDTTKSATTASITVNPALAITTPAGALTAGTTNTVYAGATIVATGGTGTKTFALASGALPGGLTLSAAGAISGTVTGGAATYTFTVNVTDAATTPVTVAAAYTITVTATPLVWTSPTTSPAAYTVGTAIAPITLVASGGTGTITYSLNSGTLPAGLTLTGGVLSGTPTAATIIAGNAVTFKATDSATPTPATVTSPTITLVVNPITLAITTSTLPTGYVGVAYNTSGYQMTSTGGTAPITWSMSPTTVGGGVTMSTSGLLSGTPTTTYASNVTITATDSATNQQQSKNVTLALTITNALSVTTTQASLPNAFVGSAYNSTGFQLAAAGGSGSGYTYSVTAGSTGTNSLASLNLSVSAAGLITGTPTATGTATFTVQVKDSLNNTASASFTITAYAVLTLPAPNPSTLGSATVGTAYTGAINATGGVSPYSWTINSVALATNGTSVSIGNGLSVSNTGTGVLSVTGTPTASTTTSFTAKITDSTSATAGPFTYMVTASSNYNISGQLNLSNNCGGAATLPGITMTLTQGATTIQAVTASSNGNFTFTNVPNGTYTVTPSYATAGASFISYPASQTAVVNNSNTSSTFFSVALGYTVSGTVAYSGAQTGQIYLSMSNNNCSGGGTQGTSISAKGAYSIRGVPPGSFTLSAFMDSLGKGVANAADASGSSSVTVGTASVSGANVTMADPSTVTLAAAPTLQGAGGFNTGAYASYKGITNSSGVEMATSYTLQWSTTSSFTAVAGSKTFPASGTHGGNVWFVNSSSTACTGCSTLTNGSVYYFRAYGTSGGTAISAYSSVVGPVTIGPNATGSTVSGSVTSTGTLTGPMFAGLYNNSTGVVYGQFIASPANTQAYSVVVPNSATAVYQAIAIIDQNNDGVIDAGDLQNTNNSGNGTLIAITGNTTGENINLPGASSTAIVATQNNESISSGGTSQSYNLSFQVNFQAKLPVAVTLQPNSPLLSDGANMLGPMDIANCATTNGNNGCGQGFQIQTNIGAVSPTTGDTYTFNVTYGDGTTGTLTATVTGVVSAFATNLLPQTGTSVSTTPTFTWTDPASASNYTYQFSLCCSSNSNIWQIPGSNSNSNGFSSSITSITWGTDPTGGGSTPSVASLTLGTNYSWQIQLQDNNGNSSNVSVNYQP